MQGDNPSTKNPANAEPVHLSQVRPGTLFIMFSFRDVYYATGRNIIQLLYGNSLICVLAKNKHILLCMVSSDHKIKAITD